MSVPYMIWTGGGGPPDRKVQRRVEALPRLPEPDPLPSGARVTFWWGESRFDFFAAAAAVRDTAWGAGRMTWLDLRGQQVLNGRVARSPGLVRALVPARYVSNVRPGPMYKRPVVATDDAIGLYPPTRPDPPHALPAGELERRLAALPAGPTPGREFTVTYPLFALRRATDGTLVGFGPAGEKPVPGKPFGLAVFTSHERTMRFVGDYLPRSPDRQPLRVEQFDRFGAFRRFLRSIRDAGTSVLFDPVRGPTGFVFADDAHPAAVLLERYLPQPVFGVSYPVYVLRKTAGPGLTLHLATGHDADGVRVELLPVFTDADLADRGLVRAPPGATVMPVPDRAAFERLLRDLPAGFGVVFDHEPTRAQHAVITRESLIENLDAMEL